MQQRTKELRKKIQNYSYSLNDMIGRGPNSVIFKGVNEVTNEMVVLKVIEQKKVNTKEGKKLLEGQIQILKKIKHNNIIDCFDVFSSINNCYIMTEYCNSGSLENLLKVRGKLEECQAISIFKDVFLGFRTFVEAGYLHRNLNPSNIFLHNNIGKIGGFGSCLKAKTGVIFQNSVVGDSNFASPQALKEYKYGIKNDIWSLGLLLYIMLHNKTPWENSCELELLKKIQSTNIALLKHLSEDTKDFLRKCLIFEEQRRITYEDMIDHPFIQTTMSNYGNFSLPQEKYERLQKDTTKQEKCMKFLVHWLEFLIKIWDISRNSLKIIINKHLQMEFNSLQRSIKDENVYGLEGWQSLNNKKGYWESFSSSLQKYQNRINNIKIQTNKIQKHQKIPKKLVGSSKKIREEAVYIYSISKILQECKYLYGLIKSGKVENKSKWMKNLDFTITYYQLCSLIVDDFSDIGAFASKSYLELILATEPQELEQKHLDQIEIKMKKLQII